jgi:hypothetical protein
MARRTFGFVMIRSMTGLVTVFLGFFRLLAIAARSPEIALRDRKLAYRVSQ